jgi:hypothetical protein
MGGSTGTPITRAFPAVLAFGSTWFGSEGGGWRPAHDKAAPVSQVTRISVGASYARPGETHRDSLIVPFGDPDRA